MDLRSVTFRAPSRRGILALAVLVAALASLVLVTTRATSAGAQDDPLRDHSGGRLALAVGTDPGTWSPAGPTWDASAMQVARSIYDRLAVYDENNQLLPELAESFEPNSTFTEWSVTLRPDITFTDGSPLDAEALKANLEAQRFSANASVLLRPVRSVFVTGPLTVNVTMTSPWSTFPELLTTQVGFVAAPATLATPEGGVAPIGTGPFTLANWNPGHTATLERNGTYWKPGLPLLAGVDVWFVADASARSAALTDGSVDMILTQTPEQEASLVAAGKKGTFTVLTDPQGEQPKLTFLLNTAQAPFLDPVARRAVNEATDRTAINAAGFDGVLRPARSFITDESAWFNDRAPIENDLARAREDAARFSQTWGEPLTFSLLASADPVDIRFASLWQSQLAEAGIVVTIDVQPVDVIAARAATGDFDAVVQTMFGGWHPDLAYVQLHQAEITNLGVPGPNLNRFGTRVVDTALDEARATADFAAQIDAYRVVQNEVFDSQAYLFLLRLPRTVAASIEVRGIEEWSTATGDSGLETEGGTVSLSDVWLAEPGANAN